MRTDDPQTKFLAVKSGATVVASQPVDRNFDDVPDGLLALVDFAPAEKKNLSVVVDEAASAEPTPKLTQAEFSAKTGGSWQPRKDKPNLKEYVGGSFATAFVDGQGRVERPLGRFGEAEVSAGAGAWGGAQKGAARLDIGPTAAVTFRLGEARGRLAADYRFRLAGNAEPRSGPALTVSAGF